MSSSRRLLIVGGIALAVWGMGYGLWYAVFAEHQALDSIGVCGFSFGCALADDESRPVAASHRHCRINICDRCPTGICRGCRPRFFAWRRLSLDHFRAVNLRRHFSYDSGVWKSSKIDPVLTFNTRMRSGTR